MKQVKRPLIKKNSGNKVINTRTENNKFGVIKTGIILLFILLELAMMATLYFTLIIAFRWFMIISFVFSILTCIYVLSSDKNSISKAVWILFILLTLTFGYIIYLLSDERVFFYFPKKRYKKIFSSSEKYIFKEEIRIDNPIVKKDTEFLFNSGKFITSKDNYVKYFNSGYLLFDDILEEIKKAKQFIFIEYFIIADGILLDRFIDILKEKKNEGVEIRIIYDSFGCHGKLSSTGLKRLKEVANLLEFNRLIPRFSVGLNYRDHRKIVIIDGIKAYTGGCNLADEYINEKRIYGYWKDNGIKVEGKAIDSFTLFFLRQWEYLSKKSEDYQKFFSHYPINKNDSIVTPYLDGLDYSLPIGKCLYENMMSSAQEKIYIMTPYLIIDETITSLLKNKALSNVDVRIIIPGIPDKPFVYGVTRNNAEKLMDYGVKIYCMKNAFVHSKILLTENSVVIGSINMDLRSFYQQFEDAIYTDDKKVRDDVDLDFTNTFELSQVITTKTKKRMNPLYRIYIGLLQIFSPLM